MHPATAKNLCTCILKAFFMLPRTNNGRQTFQRNIQWVYFKVTHEGRNKTKQNQKPQKEKKKPHKKSQSFSAKLYHISSTPVLQIFVCLNSCNTIWKCVEHKFFSCDRNFVTAILSQAKVQKVYCAEKKIHCQLNTELKSIAKDIRQ